MRRITFVITLLLAGSMVVGVSGCKRIAEVTSFWPKADSERTVPRPDAQLVFPFRGTKAPDRASVERRPLSVKIENSPASRPQTGLNSADVVYETISEGGITRFNCIFQSVIPARIGPVRSARFSDLWVVPQYDGLFFFSGASSTVNGAIRNGKLTNLSEDAGVSAPYSRSTSRPSPHNLYLNGEKTYSTAESRGYKVVSRLKGLQYNRRSQEATVAVTEVNIPFSQANRVRWVYQADSKTYVRHNNGALHKDEATGKQVESENVVVMWANYKARSRDKTGSTTYDIELGGKGRCSIFYNGQRFDATWTAARKTPPRFTDASGKAIRLAQGRTWFQVVPLDVRITAK